MALIFETATPGLRTAPERADVACFVGFIARRREQPLPDAVRQQLREAGWVDGPWRQGTDALEALENVPVVIDSWALFDRLYAWDQRPVGRAPDPVSGKPMHCATYLGAAVRSFFARGGRRAVVVRVGDPWAFLESASARAAKRRARLGRLLPGFDHGAGVARVFDPLDPSTWQGIEHLAGLDEASLLCMPDLPDACSTEPRLPPVGVALAPPPEGFVECSEEESPLPVDTGLRALLAPRLDSQGYGPWRVAVAAVRGFLARHQREVLFIGALPLPREDARRPLSDGGVHAHSDMLAFLRRSGVFEADGQHGASELSVASAFVQLGYPWLNTTQARDLPENLEPPDGVLAGLLAGSALARGTHASAAGDISVPRLRDVQSAEPVPGWGAGPSSPAARLAERVCLFAPQAGGWALQSDVTTSADEAWRSGGVSRLMATLLRAARLRGQGVLFDGNGPATWSRLQRSFEDLLKGFWRAGALSGATPQEAFSVRCDRSTMTQNDIDNGRLVTEITVWPAHSIERITVVLALASAGVGRSDAREVA
ncbi:phage tail sheath C-terminal domain-containing protein [Hydrogenophaga sp. BPS33]|uniref:phage tail sheath C-terminal domain-containing protein n=1 Tax=Hydrogenophaga sp. BPS33 TaxID=2651974 RepID=UPI00131F4FBB|nr:phage tail sheath C-terminal domain-containing protein [Hydrogenophaga sp. BPS33]QHE85160.1 phage tail protein [Hydrogenophaga sp. BPS33]